jgi:hypothetical protein
MRVGEFTLPTSMPQTLDAFASPKVLHTKDPSLAIPKL